MDDGNTRKIKGPPSSKVVGLYSQRLYPQEEYPSIVVATRSSEAVYLPTYSVKGPSYPGYITEPLDPGAQGSGVLHGSSAS